MQSSPYLLSHLVGSLQPHFPAHPGSALFVIGPNSSLRPKLPADVTHMLEGKKLRLRVIDAQWVLDFERCLDRFVSCSNSGVAAGQKRHGFELPVLNLASAFFLKRPSHQV